MPGTPTDRESQLFILDGMRFSFSSVSAYNTCPRMFRYTYLDGDKQRENNAFSDFGSFCHSILEQYYKGELELFDLSLLYTDRYDDNIVSPFPPSRNNSMAENYYEAGKRYFDSFKDPWEGYTVLGVEEKFTLSIKGIQFTGIIDLILQNPETKEIFIVDHKSKSKFKDNWELTEYLRQLYLYSIHVKEKYGKYPAKLIFNMFRIGEIVETAFDEKALEQAVWWFDETVKTIYRDEKYPLKPKGKTKTGKPIDRDFFCDHICSVRKYCSRSLSYAKKGNYIRRAPCP
ncbi:MAG: PD-(D/E)XK nuclease family protein [Clostridia bacterium]|nr:PD-(D/E)XK nuclease family protein [Clostridia bacterium]